MIKKGVYAAGLSIINTNATLNVEATISHASDAIKNGLHGVFFFWFNRAKPTYINI